MRALPVSAPRQLQRLNSNATATLAESLTIAAGRQRGYLHAGCREHGNRQRAGGDHLELGSGWRADFSYADGLVCQRYAGHDRNRFDSAYIPSSEIYGQVTTGAPTTFTAFTQTTTGGALGVSGASLVLFTDTISGTNRNLTRSDNLNLEINLTSQPQLPSDTYTGTLNLQAQAL